MFFPAKGNPPFPIARSASRRLFRPCHATIRAMSTEHILALLIQERDRLNRAIEALQGPTKRRGRPPRNPLTVSESTTVPKPARKKRAFSPAQRKAAAERMRQYWARRKSEVKPGTKKKVKAAS